MYQCRFRSWYMKMSDPNFIPLNLNFIFDLNIIILIFHYSNTQISTLWGILHCSELSWLWGRQITNNTYRFPEQKKKILFFCDYHFSFIPSLGAPTSFLTSECVFQLRGRYFISYSPYPASSSFFFPLLPFPHWHM